MLVGYFPAARLSGGHRHLPRPVSQSAFLSMEPQSPRQSTKSTPLSLLPLSLLCLARGRGGSSGEDLVEIGKCARASILVLKHGGAAVKYVDAALLEALAELGRDPYLPAGRARVELSVGGSAFVCWWNDRESEDAERGGWRGIGEWRGMTSGVPLIDPGSGPARPYWRGKRVSGG
jgi:hypothetical protein